MATTLATVSFLVRDYDEAIAWFTKALGFSLLEDTPQGEGTRWVIVAPPSGQGARLLLAKAANPEQQKAIGHAAGGRVGGDFCARRTVRRRRTSARAGRNHRRAGVVAGGTQVRLGA